VTPLSLGADAACIERDPGDLQKPWAALAANRPEPSIFFTPEWLAVARAHDRAHPLTLAIGAPVFGIAALSRDDDGTLRFGGGELTDVQDVLAAPGCEGDAAAAFARWLVASGAPRIELSYIFEDSPTLPILAAALAAGYHVEQTRLVTSPWMALPADFESYVASLGKKARHELRRKIRRLETTAQATYRNATESERAAVLDRFFELHRLSRGVKAAFMTTEVERFFRDIADALGALGRLRLGVLSVDGNDAAVLFGFAYRGVLAAYNAAYDPGLSSLSIGIVSHAWAIRDAIAEGLGTYDLLRGDERYKYDLGAQDRFLARLVATRR
jgi:CelD/BcsL family acetyltransferase involved in cellulose biosynthesis